ncbi:MAG TPA: hypothetical protein VIV35_10535, partial [Chitinophagaceae bacterium]
MHVKLFYIRKVSLLVLSFFWIGHSYAQEITIYTIPSPKGINWKSPGTLMLSYISNTFAKSRYGSEKHPIGHMIVELKDSSRYALCGATSKAHSGMTKKVMREGYGLGILFETINGKLEEQDINLSQLRKRSEAGDIAFVTFKINQLVFDRLWQYLHEYKLKGYDKLYNGSNEPRKGLGAGCSAFAHSFWEVGGLADVLPSNEWEVNVLVPEKLMGGSRENPGHVQFFKVLFASRWGDPKIQTYRPLFLYDPTLFYHWIIKKYNSSIGDNFIHTSSIKKAKGLIIDCTAILPVNEPIWIN